jgi:hypothetical protein
MARGEILIGDAVVTRFGGMASKNVMTVYDFERTTMSGGPVALCNWLGPRHQMRKERHFLSDLMKVKR